MDFTIITPSFNYGRYLGDCLGSVASQTNVELEHLVFDAGSSDESSAVASRFPHAVWTEEPDTGMSDAINKGFDKATGDWVMWLNADDRLKPGALEKILPFLKRSSADIVYGDWDFISSDGDLLRKMNSPKWSLFVHVHHHCYIGSTAAFYRKSSVIDQNFRLREDFKYAMDSEFYARLHSNGKTFEHVSANLADFRLHGSNLSQNNRGNDRDLETLLKNERQNNESRAIRRAYGITLFKDPYLNGLVDGILWIAAKGFKQILRLTTK